MLFPDLTEIPLTLALALECSAGTAARASAAIKTHTIQNSREYLDTLLVQILSPTIFSGPAPVWTDCQSVENTVFPGFRQSNAPVVCRIGNSAAFRAL